MKNLLVLSFSAVSLTQEASKTKEDTKIAQEVRPVTSIGSYWAKTGFGKMRPYEPSTKPRPSIRKIFWVFMCNFVAKSKQVCRDFCAFGYFIKSRFISITSFVHVR